MHEYETLLVERPQEGVLLLTLNRPERYNAITFQMFDELHDLCRAVNRDRDLRAVVITGAGRGFCSGLDLDEAATLPDMTPAEMLLGQEHWAGAYEALHDLPQPVIAAVNGAAAGGGLGLALAADIRIASTEARFNAAFVRIGLSAGDVGVSWSLPRVVGLGHASDMMLTGRFVDAEEAERIGLVNRVVDPAELLEAAFEVAGQIASNTPFGVMLTKRVLQANVDAGLAASGDRGREPRADACHTGRGLQGGALGVPLEAGAELRRAMTAGRERPTIGIESQGTSVRDMGAIAAAADRAGLDAAWAPELYNRSATVTLAEMAARTDAAPSARRSPTASGAVP